MNILMALSQLEVTGAEVYGVTLSDELIKRGNNVIIVSDTLTKESKAKYIKLEFNKRGLSERINQIKTLLKIIKENDIHIVHAHSRASSWSSQIACKIAGIPLITTTHGRQPVHLSRKIFKAFGDLTIPVCENIQTHLINELGVSSKNTVVLRNPINTIEYPFAAQKKDESKKILSIIGRLSGPKGEVAYKLLEILFDMKNLEIRLIGGKDIPEKFQKFFKNKNIKFMGYVNDVPEKIKESDIIVGAGRVAVEGILSGKPVIAIGEAKYIGLITNNNLSDALASNFGDIEFSNSENFNWNLLKNDVESAFTLTEKELFSLRENVEKEFDLNIITDKIEKIYARLYVLKRKYDIPVIMYHRVVNDESEGGVHGTYITAKKFDEHMRYLKEHNYHPITFKELLKINYRNRFNNGKKYVILTFDDGYEDNYKIAFPILKKYEFNCIIYLVSHLNYNKWDVEVPENPEKKFPLMTWDMIKEMQEYGIEFGGHTMTHQKLVHIPFEQAKEEIASSTQYLEEKLGEKLVCFAYPYGDLNEQVKEFVRNSGYSFAVATDSGDLSFSEDLFQIRRIGIFPTNNMLSFKRKVHGNYNFIKLRREQKSSKS
ncbi:polysaccharide deacetylase family protein [Fusobacterium varium]|uniref:polysaccharide deacetylase family protein n=1 Tax=Fusobacterium varium TaxID=856 RepID=UPI0022E3E5A4|nr:polysaccharide deacetylase family protein [Fusobacterium varium]